MKDGKHVPALAAGGHYDPLKTGKHEGPYGKGTWETCPPFMQVRTARQHFPLLHHV